MMNSHGQRNELSMALDESPTVPVKNVEGVDDHSGQSGRHRVRAVSCSKVKVFSLQDVSTIRRQAIGGTMQTTGYTNAIRGGVTNCVHVVDW